MGSSYSGVDINSLMNGSSEYTAAVVISLVISGLGCFFGYKLTKLYIAICGFCFGMLVGTILGALIKVAALVFLLGLGLGIAFAIFSYKAYKIGVFLTSFMTVGLFVASFMIVLTGNRTKPVMELAAGAVAGIIGGIIAVKFTKPLMIIMTALCYGASFGTMLAILIKMPKLSPIFGLASIVLGMVVQIKTNNGLSEDNSRPSQNYAAPQYVNPYATGAGYNQFGGQQQSFPGGQPGYMNGQPGYMNGQPGYMNGQPGYMNGQQGYMNGQQGYMNGGQPPQDDGFLGNGHLPQ